jgi:hypothetical protein
MGAGAPTSRCLDGFLGLGFLGDSKHGLQAPSCNLSILFFFKNYPAKDPGPTRFPFPKTELVRFPPISLRISTFPLRLNRLRT